MMMKTYTLSVLNIKRETEVAVTLCFKQPGLKKIKYQAGQYLTLIFRINGRRYIRPYSFSSAPGLDPFLEVTIKRVPFGIVSNYINDKVKVGDVIEVLPPMGEFVFPKETTAKEVFLWGVGSGITPLFSLAKSILNDVALEYVNVNMIYGNHNVESTIFWSSLHELELQYPTRFKIKHFHTRAQELSENVNCFKGRIEVEMILSNFETDLINTSLHYICGPVDLKKNIKQSLSNYNVPIENVLIEDFELVKNPEDFKDVENRTIKLVFEGKETVLAIDKGKTILESALDAGLELPYSCQTGSCSTCKGKLLSGEMKMIGLVAPRLDLEKNEFLLCCSHPFNDEVVVTI